MKQDHRRPYLGPEYHKPQKGTCRWCAEPITKPDGTVDTRRTWHTACAEAYLMATDSGRQRRAVWIRDMGICAACGQDSIRQARITRDTTALLEGLWVLENGRNPPHELLRDNPQERWRIEARWRDRKHREVQAALRARGIPKSPPASPWQADHILPLCEANGDRRYFTMENLQTLCHACHSAKTAADTARLRASRKPPEPPRPAHPDLFDTYPAEHCPECWCGGLDDPGWECPREKCPVREFHQRQPL